MRVPLVRISNEAGFIQAHEFLLLSPMSTGSARAAVTIPGNARALADIVARCRKMVTKRAMMSAGAVLVPIPGLDLAADLALLAKLVDEVNQAFGLTPAQIDQLPVSRRMTVYKAVVTAGGAMVGRVITKSLLIKALARVGVRMSAKQAARFVPIAGQALAAGLSFAAMRYVGLAHVCDCERVTKEVLKLS